MKYNDIGEHVIISASVLDGIREINRRLTMLEEKINPNPKCISVKEAADMLGISVSAMRKKLKQPGFPSIQTEEDGKVLIRVASLVKWLDVQESVV